MRSPTRENARHLKQLSMCRAKASVRAFLLNSSGVAAVEFALLAPLLMLMTFGTFEITRALIAHKRFQRATAMVGDLVSREKQIGSSEVDPKEVLKGMMVAAEYAMEPFSSTPLQMAIFQLRANSTDATKTTVEWSWSQPDLPITKCPNEKPMPAPNMISKGDAAIVIEARYTYEPFLANIVPGLATTMTWSDTMTFAPRWGSVFYGQDSLNTDCPP
jgi:Flp pilus assembly protein TadG